MSSIMGDVVKGPHSVTKGKKFLFGNIYFNLAGTESPGSEILESEGILTTHPKEVMSGEKTLY